MPFSTKAAGLFLSGMAVDGVSRANVHPSSLATPALMIPTSTVIPQMFAGAGIGNAAINAAKFNAALLYLHQIGGGRLRIPYKDGGIYEMGAPLLHGGNISIECDNGVTIKRMANSGFLRNSLGVSSGTGRYTGNGNVVIEGGVWDGNGQQFYQTFNAFEAGNADRYELLNLDVLDVVRAHALDLSACRDWVVDNCRFMGFSHLRTSPDGYGATTDGLSDDRSFSEAVQLDHNTPSSFSFGALDRTVNRRGRFTNNYVGPNPYREPDATFGSWCVGIGSHGGVHNRYQTDMKISGNTFEECSFSGVRSWKWEGAQITGNRFIGCTRGFHDTPVSFNTVSAEDENGIPSGVGQSGRQLDISGNSFAGTIETDIFFALPTLDDGEPLHYRDVVTIRGNTHVGTGANGVTANALRGAVLSDNVFLDVNRPYLIGPVDGMTISGGSARGVTNEYVWQTEVGLPAALRNTGLSKNLNITGLTGENIGRAGINLAGAVKRFSISGCVMTGVSQEVGTRHGITVNTNCENGFIHGNHILQGPYPVQHAIGIQVTGSCANVDVAANVLRGHSGDAVSYFGTGTSGLVP